VSQRSALACSSRPYRDRDDLHTLSHIRQREGLCLQCLRARHSATGPNLPASRITPLSLILQTRAKRCGPSRHLRRFAILAVPSRLARGINLPDIVGAFLAGLAVNAVTPSRVTIGAASLPITAPMTDIGL